MSFLEPAGVTLPVQPRGLQLLLLASPFVSFLAPPPTLGISNFTSLNGLMPKNIRLNIKYQILYMINILVFSLYNSFFLVFLYQLTVFAILKIATSVIR